MYWIIEIDLNNLFFDKDYKIKCNWKLISK